MTTYIGKPVRRVEDERLITGAGRYSADIDLENQAHAVMVRSPHAHADIREIETEQVLAMPGVLAVVTGDDLVAAGIGPIPSFTRIAPYRFENADGTEMADASQYPLARDRVRYVGEPVALVLAETVALARDAAEQLHVDYAELDAVAGLDEATAETAPQLWPDSPGNRSCHWETGDASKTNAAFTDAARVVDIEVTFPRRIIAYMEPRAIVAEYKADTDHFTIEVGCQSAHWIRDGLALVLNHPADKIHVKVPDVGGGFGSRSIVAPEFVAAVHAARLTGRPVKWVCERTESFTSDMHARSQRVSAALALDSDGNFLAVRLKVLWCHGGYLAPRSLYVLLNAMPPMVCGPYRIGHQHFTLEGVFTNTTPIASYRGVGRSEAGYILERLVDAAARELDVDPVALRRKNLISPGEMPYASAAGLLYENADFEKHFDQALEALDADGFAARQSEARTRGCLRGIGAVPYIQTAGGAPDEYADVLVAGNGTVRVAVGTQDFGMGHKTTYGQLAADLLGVEPAEIDVIFGDTNLVAKGQGGHGSRSMRIGGNAIHKTIMAVTEKGRHIAGEKLEAAVGDIVFDGGLFRVEGTDRTVTLYDVATLAEARGEKLDAAESYVVDGAAFPNGAHACEVEIDPATGHVTLVNFVTVIDPGVVLNPLLAEGQMHGGIAQAVGEAMFENVVYDNGSGQLLSGSFMDYALPHADELPWIETHLSPRPSTANVLGVKGIGETGCMGSQAAIVNAALQAMAPLGVTHIDMPLTSEKVWRALTSKGS